MRSGAQPPPDLWAGTQIAATASTSRLLTSPALSRAERSALEGAVGRAETIRANSDLVREGGRAGDLFLLLEGWASRYSTTREGGRQFSAILVAGDVCNLESLTFERLDCGVRTLTACRVAAIPRGRAATLAAEHPGVARAFTRLAMVDNAVLNRWTVSLGRRSARERLAHLMCELSVRLEAERSGASSFDLPLTQEHVSDALGLTPVHVNRMMRTLREEGLVEIAGRVVTLPDIDRLRRVGGFDPGYLHLEAATYEGSD